MLSQVPQFTSAKTMAWKLILIFSINFIFLSFPTLPLRMHINDIGSIIIHIYDPEINLIISKNYVFDTNIGSFRTVLQITHSNPASMGARCV